MFFRNYFSIVIFVSLLIWGPINHSLSGWLVIRIGYLILIPVLMWFFLKWIWNRWQPTRKFEKLLERTFSSFICCILLIMAIIEATSDTHIGNSMWIHTQDGMEAVGEDIIVQGPAWENVIILFILIGLIFWFGVLKNDLKNHDK